MDSAIKIKKFTKWQLFLENHPLYILWGVSIFLHLFLWKPFEYFLFVDSNVLFWIACVGSIGFAFFGSLYIRDTLLYRKIPEPSTTTIMWIRIAYISLLIINFTVYVIARPVSGDQIGILLFFGVICAWLLLRKRKINMACW